MKKYSTTSCVLCNKFPSLNIIANSFVDLQRQFTDYTVHLSTLLRQPSISLPLPSPPPTPIPAATYLVS